MKVYLLFVYIRLVSSLYRYVVRRPDGRKFWSYMKVHLLPYEEVYVWKDIGPVHDLPEETSEAIHFKNQLKRIPWTSECRLHKIMQVALNLGQGHMSGSLYDYVEEVSDDLSWSTCYHVVAGSLRGFV